MLFSAQWAVDEGILPEQILCTHTTCQAERDMSTFGEHHIQIHVLVAYGALSGDVFNQIQFYMFVFL